MVTLEDIQQRTGVSINTLQYWRRKQNEGLLPEPIAVKKKVIYFDELIIERVEFIQIQLKMGIKLTSIKEMLEKDLLNEYRAVYLRGLNEADQPPLESSEDLLKRWGGNCKAEVCHVLNLDPAISGHPEILVRQSNFPLFAEVSIISNGWVHFAILKIFSGIPSESISDGYAIEVESQAKIKVSDYGLFMALLVKMLAEHNLFIEIREVPGLLFGKVTLPEQIGKFGLESIEEAQKLTKILRAGQEFVKHL